MCPIPSILLVEDEPALRGAVAESLEARGFAVAQSPDAADALTRLESFAYDGLLLDLGLPDADGMQVLEAAVERYPAIRSIILTGQADVSVAVEAMRRGAIDYLTKPCSVLELAQRFHHSFARHASAVPVLPPPSRPIERILGTASSMQRVLATIERVAPMQSTVLIQGESGTGKELVARTIHSLSPRRQQPFVAFSAAAIPEGLTEAELFGHVKGAFTGAVGSRVGRFEAAHEGTLFIDEVASTPLPLQAKLLRALQEREIERVGESRSVKVDVRIIAATNVDLRQLVAQGRFREDLYYRLNVVPVVLPPLRERPEDIPALAQVFVRKSCLANGLAAKAFSQQTLRVLMRYDWPGNVRELENAVEHAVVMTGERDEIGLEALPTHVQPREGAPAMAVTLPEGGLDFVSVVARFERDLILQSLDRTGGNKSQAAQLLNLSRTTLIDKLQRFQQAEERAAAVQE